jgi:hypothetical protein
MHPYRPFAARSRRKFLLLFRRLTGSAASLSISYLYLIYLNIFLSYLSLSLLS